MFPSRYFAPRYFAPRYWPPVGDFVGEIAIPKSFSLSITQQKAFEMQIKQVVPASLTIYPVDNIYTLEVRMKMQEAIASQIKQIHAIRFIW